MLILEYYTWIFYAVLESRSHSGNPGQAAKTGWIIDHSTEPPHVALSMVWFKPCPPAHYLMSCDIRCETSKSRGTNWKGTLWLSLSNCWKDTALFESGTFSCPHVTAGKGAKFNRHHIWKGRIRRVLLECAPNSSFAAAVTAWIQAMAAEEKSSFAASRPQHMVGILRLGWVGDEGSTGS